MDKKPSDNEVDRLLGLGEMSGPEVDRLWQAVGPRVVKPARSWSALLASWWMRAGMGLAVAAGALVLFVRPDEMRPRGDGKAVLQASCGEACVVGQPVYLRVTHPSGNACIFIVMGGAMIVDGAPLAAGLTTLNVSITPEPSDVTKGLTLEYSIVPGTPDEARKTLALQERVPDGKLHLDVKAAP